MQQYLWLLQLEKRRDLIKNGRIFDFSRIETNVWTPELTLKTGFS